MFTNIVINDYVYATRFIASWNRSGGKLKTGKDYHDFRDWLESLKEIEKSDIDQIVFLASNGKLELETSAKKFIANLDM